MSKKEITSWQECNVCQVLINSKDNSLHLKCSEESAQLKSPLLQHGYIKDGIFHAKIDQLKSRDKSKLRLPGTLTKYKPLVLLHPSVMEEMNFGLGDLMVITTDCDERVFYCWSCDFIPPSSIILPQRFKILHLDDNHATVQRYNDAVELSEVAMEIYLLPKKPYAFMNSKHFTDHILKEHDRFLLRKGMLLDVNYLGTQCELEIIRFIGSHSDSDDTNGLKDNCEDSIDSITEKYTKLSVTDGDVCDKTRSVENANRNENLLEEEKNSEIRYSTPASTKKKKTNSNISRPPILQKAIVPAVIKSKYNYYKAYTSLTLIIIKKNKTDLISSQPSVLFRDIGGLESQLQSLTTMLSSFLPSSENGSLPSGILISGPVGTGKSLVMQAIINECLVSAIIVKASEYNRSTSGIGNLKKKFHEAAMRAPCLLILDDLHLLFEGAKSGSCDERTIIDEFANLMDNLPKHDHRKVVVIAATNKLNCIDSVLRRQRRFEVQINFHIPSNVDRLKILKGILQVTNNFLDESDIVKIADTAHGYTGLDLKEICNKASIRAELRSVRDERNYPITATDLREGFKDYQPTSMNLYVPRIPKVYWSDIGGMDHLIMDLLEMVDLPLNDPKAFVVSEGILAKGILMYGPPGCSKTMTAQALATESKLNFIDIKGPELLKQWVGESERAVRDLFSTARSAAPCILFFDELESIAPNQESTSSGTNVSARVLSQLLTEIDGIDIVNGVSIIAATNRPDMINPALLRPGRFDRVLYVGLPDEAARKEIFRVILQKKPLSDDIDYDILAAKTDGYTGCEIVELCDEAAKQVIYRDVTSTNSVVAMDDLLDSLQRCLPKTTSEQLKFYEEYDMQFRY